MRLLNALIALALLACLVAPGSAPAAGNEEDQEAIAALREAGADLSEPLLLEFVFHFELAENAQRMWNALAGDGFKGQIRPAGADPGFMLFARKEMLVEESALTTLREKLEREARAFGGTYEGWGAP